MPLPIFPVRRPARPSATALRLAVLAGATFVFVTTETQPVALIAPMARGLSVSESRVGLLMSAYAAAAALTAIPLTVLATRIPRRPLVISTVTLLVVSQAILALAPGLHRRARRPGSRRAGPRRVLVCRRPDRGRARPARARRPGHRGGVRGQLGRARRRHPAGLGPGGARRLAGRGRGDGRAGPGRRDRDGARPARHRDGARRGRPARRAGGGGAPPRRDARLWRSPCCSPSVSSPPSPTSRR